MTVEHQTNPDGSVTIWTYPASGERYCYKFDSDGEITKKTKTIKPATSEEQTKIVAPKLTPAVKSKLKELGY